MGLDGRVLVGVVPNLRVIFDGILTRSRSPKMRSSMLQLNTRRWLSRSGILVMSWQRESMAMHEDSNLSKPLLM
jgi:hypothetical protein